MPEGAVAPGAEPLSVAGGPDGVLVLHGLTGSPFSMRPLALALAAAGFSVELPLLPGHGTSLDDMVTTGWADWSAAVERAYAALAARCRRLVVAGLSMGGTLACWLASRHPEIAGLVCVNPAVEPPADSFLELLDGFRSGGAEIMPGIGSDIAKPGVTEHAYSGVPIAGLRSLLDAIKELAPRLGDIACPLLLLTSAQDHVVPPSASELLAASVSGKVERVALARSYHVATLDFDADEINRRAVEFAQSVTSGGS